jgi:cytochrome c-type biogenesis protein CcmF
MGEPLTENAWAMRVHVKPFVRWIWLGALMMAFGSCLSAMDKRYRKRVAAKRAAPEYSGAVSNE